MKSFFLGLCLLAAVPAFAQVTISIEAKITESAQMDLVKIHQPVFVISDPEFFGYERLVPAISSIDNYPSNGLYTAQFICAESGYGEFVKADYAIWITGTPVLRFMDSSDASRTRFHVFDLPNYTHEIFRTVWCRMSH